MTTAEVTWAGSVDIDGLRRSLAGAYPASSEFLLPDPDPLRALVRGGSGSSLPPPLGWSLAAARGLGGLPDGFDPAGLSWRELELAAGRRAFLVTGGLPEAVWARIGLPDHECDPGAGVLVAELAAALRHLQSAHPAFANLLLGVAPTLVLARLRPGARGEPTITSASLPTMPGIVYASRKVFRHIPPNTVSDTPLVPLAAENLLHEAVHQLVNLVLLTRDILPAGYSAAASPTIPIAWRRDQDVQRNKHWELDRVLHATAVYVGVVRLRTVELASRNADDAVARWLHASLGEGLEALDYLSRSLVDHVDAFGEHGARLVPTLRQDAERAMSEA